MTTDSTPRMGELPERFGRYRILKKLGQGGMGAVYLAHDSELNRLVALKTPLVADSPEAAERFRRAARVAAPLHHPNICPIYEAGAIDGVPYLTMAYIEGTTLAERLRSGRMPSTEAATLVRAVALALAEAHDCGVIHRDVKPSNILVNRRGEPVLTDFGLARCGTPAYLSPEQGRDESAGDVYSLGVVLYELLTGRLPFHGSTADELFDCIIHDEAAPPSSNVAGLDPRLDALCLRAMAKDPAERFPDMAAFAAALAPYCDGTAGAGPGAGWSLRLSESKENRPSSGEEKPAEPTRRRPWRLVLGIVVCSAFAAAGIYAFIQMRYLQKSIPTPPASVASDADDDADAAEAIHSRPESARALLVRGRAEYRQGRDDLATVDFLEAHRRFAEGVEEEPIRAREYTDRAWCYLRIDRCDEALTDCAAAVHLDSGCTEAWLLSAQVWHLRGRRDRELAAYADAWRAVKPNAAGQFADLARIALALDRPDDALRACDEAARRDPRLPEVFEARARAWLRKGDREVAAADFARAAEVMKPRWSRDYLDRSILHELAGDPDRALADAARAVALAPRLPAALRQRGTVRRAKQDHALAVADFREAALILAPRFSADYLDRAWLYNELGEHSRAAADLETALVLGLQSGEVHRELAHACRNLKQYDRAGPHLDQALRLLPADALLYGERGALSFAQGRYDDAARAYSRLLALAPEDAAAFASRGDALFQTSDYAGAVADYTRALRRTPADDRAALADVYDRRGVAFVRLGQFAEAAADYSRAIDNDPDDPVLYRNRAAARLRAGDDAAAQDDVRKAEALSGARP